MRRQSQSAVESDFAIHPLQDGDCLTRDEFFLRYESSPQISRAELIRGVVHVIAQRPADGDPSSGLPISATYHAQPLGDLIGWMGYYMAYTPGVCGAGPTTIFAVSADSCPEPDGLLRILPECGGRTRTDAGGFLHGSPELVVEIADATAAHDLGPKRALFEGDGVREYLVWRTRAGAINWFTLKRRRYALLRSDTAGVLRSVAFPGLWLDTAAIVAGDTRQILTTLQLGLASPEHAAFVAKLAARAKRKRK